jgi:hypothetical protein
MKFNADYDTHYRELVEIKNLVSAEKLLAAKDHIESKKKSFLAKYNHLLEEKRKNLWLI